MTAFDTLLQVLSLDFMQRALAISVLVAVPTALLSCFLVLKGWSLMGDAISHAVLPGIVLAHVAGVPLPLGAFAAGMTCALGAGYLQANSRVKQDTVLGVVFSGMFALGLVLYTKIETEVHLDHILFGDVLGVSSADLRDTALIAAVIALAVAAKWRDLLLFAFDPVQARAVGLPVRLLHYGLLAMLSLAVVGALKAAGIILTVALLIAPGAVAFLLARSFGRMLATAVAASLLACGVGIGVSAVIDSAPGPTIVLALMAEFALAFAATARRQAASAASPSSESVRRPIASDITTAARHSTPAPKNAAK